MRKSLGAALCLAAGTVAWCFATPASADIVGGSVCENSTNAQNATVANALACSPTLTFQTNDGAGNTLNFTDFAGGNGTLGVFLESNGMVTTGATLAAHVNDPLSNGVGPGAGSLGDLFLFTGTVSVTHGQTFTVNHDDGLQLKIFDGTPGGLLVIDAAGPTSPTTTIVTYTGATGTFNFQMAYGECCGDPAELNIALPLQTVPGPIVGAGFPGLMAACGGLLALARRRRNKAAPV
jgi:hypothetical protein